MAAIKRFEDLICWQEARKLVKFVFTLTQKESFQKEYELRGALRKTVISVMNNIAEGFSRFNKNDFIRFLDYPQSSASELLSLTYVVEDMALADHEEVQTFRQLIISTRNPTLGLVKYLRQNDFKKSAVNDPGHDYKPSKSQDPAIDQTITP